MKLSLTLFTCLIFLSPNVVLNAIYDDLVTRDGVWFKKFSQVAFVVRLLKSQREQSRMEKKKVLGSLTTLMVN